jgi:hypothetical protein
VSFCWWYRLIFTRTPIAACHQSENFSANDIYVKITNGFVVAFLCWTFMNLCLFFLLPSCPLTHILSYPFLYIPYFLSVFSSLSYAALTFYHNLFSLIQSCICIFSPSPCVYVLLFFILFFSLPSPLSICFLNFLQSPNFCSFHSFSFLPHILSLVLSLTRSVFSFLLLFSFLFLSFTHCPF